MTIEERLERTERGNPGNDWGQCIPCWGQSRCPVPEMGTCLESSGKSKRKGVPGGRQARRTAVGSEFQRGQWGLIELWLLNYNKCVGSHWKAESWDKTRSGGGWKVGMHKVLPCNLTGATLLLLPHYLTHCLFRNSLIPGLQRLLPSHRSSFLLFFFAWMLSDQFSHSGLLFTLLVSA